MRNARHALILLVGLLVLSSGVVAAPQRASRPAKPAAASPTPPRAATVPTRTDPFVGVWKLNAAKSKYESGGAPTSFTRTYEDRGGGTIFMTTDVSIPQGSTRAYLVYRRDGKPYPEAAAGAEAIRMVTVRSIDPRTESMNVSVCAGVLVATLDRWLKTHGRENYRLPEAEREALLATFFERSAVGVDRNSPLHFVDD